MQELLFVRRRDEAQLYQTAGHRRLAEHQEACLLDTFILSGGSRTGSFLYIFCQFDTLGHVVVLYELEHDIALRRFRVKALVALLVVRLVLDNGILSHSDIQVIGSTVHTQSIGFHASCHTPLWKRVSMDGHEEVGLVAVSNVRTGMQRNKDVSFAGIDYFHVGTVAFDQSAKSQRHIQVDGFFLSNAAYGAGIVAAVPGVDNQRKARLCSLQG